MTRKLKPPPLPPRKKSIKPGPKATQEVLAAQIVSEEPSLENLADRYLNGEQRRTPPPPPPRASARGKGTVEVESAQILSSSRATVDSHGAASRDPVIYARAELPIPDQTLSEEEVMLISLIDGERDAKVIASITGIEVDEVCRLLAGLERRSCIVRRS